MKRQLIYFGAALVVLLGVFFFAKMQMHPSMLQTKSQTKIFILEVKQNKLISGPTTLHAIQGDTVVIRITADVDGELHLHGYDKHVDFKKGEQAQLSVAATIAGRFPYELEDTKTEIGALEVQPR